MKRESGIPSHLKKIGAYEAHDRRIFGEGIGVAVLDTGIYPHPDFFREGNRLHAFSDFVNHHHEPYDDGNHGTHICGIIASGGKDARGRYIGIAPGAHLICAKILGADGNGKVATALAAFQWIHQWRHFYNIRILNISMGMPVLHPHDEFSPFMQGIHSLWDAGILVVAAAGNNGPKPKSITAPGIGREIVTVGSCEERFSGRGPTINCIKKPDLCAPGSQIYSCKNRGQEYTYKSGTSMSTPMVCGAAALLLSIHPELTNREVKERLMQSSKSLGLPWQQQGAGMLNIPALLEL